MKKIDLTKKYLVTSGCSFTNGHHMKEKGSWAYYLADILGMELHNRAVGGQGNEFICDSIIYYLENRKDILDNCIVGIAWSETTRLLSPVYYEDVSCTNWETVTPTDFLKSKQHGDGKFSHLSDASNFFSDISFCIYRTYMSVIKLTYFLKANNIPYFFIDAINKNKVDIDESTIRKYTGQTKITLEGNMHVSPPINISSADEPFRNVFTKNINDKFFGEFLNVCGYDTILEFMFGDEDDDNKRYDRLQKGNGGHPNDIASKEIAESIYNQIS